MKHSLSLRLGQCLPWRNNLAKAAGDVVLHAAKVLGAGHMRANLELTVSFKLSLHVASDLRERRLSAMLGPTRHKLFKCRTCSCAGNTAFGTCIGAL